MNTIRVTLNATTMRLSTAGVDQPAQEARLLLAGALGTAPQSLPDWEAVLTDLHAERLEVLVARREQREPMAFILGSCGFWTLDLEVSPATLIPRPDSETLIEAAIAEFPEKSTVLRVLDLGTGTGCLLLAALTVFPEAFGIGVDLSIAACALAERNALANGLAGRSAFLAGDWDAPIGARMDLVLCNPPYIRSDDIAHLMPEVKRFEPLRALDGGRDGLVAYRRIIPTLPERLSRGGVAIVELGMGQAESVSELAEQAGFRHIVARADLAGVPRALVLADPAKKLFGTGGAGR